ncbi:hypothetical protein [Falsirhodobacter sp. 1013]|uniref:hypothetical protein n=1 Tax=Falsirhodobacter sp. 1013 TaxID=3417566 RepID=UPI003EBF45F0
MTTPVLLLMKSVHANANIARHHGYDSVVDKLVEALIQLDCDIARSATECSFPKLRIIQGGKL